MTDTGWVRLLDRFTSAVQAAWDSASARLWTRAAIAAGSFASAPRRRTLRVTRGIGVHVIGSVILAAAVGLMLWNNFGPGPIDVFIVALTEHTGLPLAVALWLTIGTMLMLAWALGRKPGVGSIVTPIVIGPAIQFFVSVFDAYEAPTALIAKVGVQLLALVFVGLGAGAIIASGLGAGMGELLAQAGADKSGQPPQLVRVGCELTWLAAGVLLGGPVGLGTLIVAVAIGPAVGRGSLFVNGILGSLTAAARRQIHAHAAPAMLPTPPRVPVAA
jgi:uncharacterized membrane protein YczE